MVVASRTGPCECPYDFMMATLDTDPARLDWVKTTIRATVSAAVLLALYYLVPIEHRAHQSVALRLAGGLALFVVVLFFELKAISNSHHPKLRAVSAMAVIIPLFIVVFAWLYLTLSQSDPGAFGSLLTRTDSLYFTVTVFSTVGFGDITAKSEVARLLATVQMVGDLVVLGVVVRLITTTVSRGEAKAG